MFHNTKSWHSFCAGSAHLCWFLAHLLLFVPQYSVRRIWTNGFGMQSTCTTNVQWYIQICIAAETKETKKTGWKQKLRFVAIMQFLEVPWNGPWALWEGYCGSAMQHTTLNSAKLPGSTTEVWELQTAFTASPLYLFYTLHASRYQLLVVTSHRKQSISTQLQPWLDIYIFFF